MTDDRDILDRAREALDGITPGEWTYRDIIDGKHNVTVDMWDVASCSGGPIEDDEERTKYAAANAEFIAAAPHLVRVLLATIECERISHQRTVDAYHRASGAEVAWRSNAEGWQDRARAAESALEAARDSAAQWEGLWRQDQETAATALRERDEALAEVERLRGNQRVEGEQP